MNRKTAGMSEAIGTFLLTTCLDTLTLGSERTIPLLGSIVAAGLWLLVASGQL